MARTVIFGIFVLGFFFIPVTEAKESSVPKVHLVFNSLFDSICEKQTGYTVAQEWKSELRNLLPELVKEWNDRGAQLLRATQKVVGRPFQRHDFGATLSLCSFPSMSHPLLVNARYALKSFTKQPIPMIVLLSTIYHEILHHYVNGRHDSALLKKYETEDPRVKAHLHLLAVQQASFVHLGWKKDLEEVIKKDEALPPGHYKRAWQIIKIEGYQAFVDELRM